MAGIDNRWRELLGRADLADGEAAFEVSWDNVDQSRSAEHKSSMSAGGQRGHVAVALYPMLDGRWCAFTFDRKTKGRAYVIGTQEQCEQVVIDLGHETAVGLALAGRVPRERGLGRGT